MVSQNDFVSRPLICSPPTMLGGQKKIPKLTKDLKKKTTGCIMVHWSYHPKSWESKAIPPPTICEWSKLLQKHLQSLTISTWFTWKWWFFFKPGLSIFVKVNVPQPRFCKLQGCISMSPPKNCWWFWGPRGPPWRRRGNGGDLVSAGGGYKALFPWPTKDPTPGVRCCRFGL